MNPRSVTRLDSFSVNRSERSAGEPQRRRWRSAGDIVRIEFRRPVV